MCFKFSNFFFLLLAINNIINNLNQVKKYRKLFYFLFVFFSTIVTPPDVFSQLFVSFFLISFYEILTFLKIVDKTIS